MKLRKNSSINKDLARYAELTKQCDALEQERAEIKERIIQYMTTHTTDTIENEEHKATYKLIVSNRIDSTALKKAFPDIAKQVTKVCESYRFLFN